MVSQKHSKTTKTSQKQLMAQAKAMFKNTNPKSNTARPVVSNNTNLVIIKTASPKTYIAITIITFAIAVLVRTFSFGWYTVIMVYVSPILLILYFVSTIMFSLLRVKTRPLFILFNIVIYANLLHAFTFVDALDAGSSTGLLSGLQDAVGNTPFTPLNFSLLSLLVAIIAEISLIVMMIITKRKLKSATKSPR